MGRKKLLKHNKSYHMWLTKSTYNNSIIITTNEVAENPNKLSNITKYCINTTKTQNILTGSKQGSNYTFTILHE